VQIAAQVIAVHVMAPSSHLYKAAKMRSHSLTGFPAHFVLPIPDLRVSAVKQHQRLCLACFMADAVGWVFSRVTSDFAVTVK